MTTENTWNAAKLSTNEDDALWEFFHENTKLNPYDQFPPQEYIRKHMESLWPSLPYQNRPVTRLPEPDLAFERSLGEAMKTRVSGREMERGPLSLQTLSTLLFCAYGVTRDNQGTGFPRPFRTVPSGGGLYPLELYIHITRCPELETGIYHYNPSENLLAFLHKGDASRDISRALMQPEVAMNSTAMIMVTGVFERSTFKYGARGYRFACIEAGHVAQNVNLASNGLGLSCLNIGGYKDRDIDRLLNLDGVRSSTIYMMAVGHKPAG